VIPLLALYILASPLLGLLGARIIHAGDVAEGVAAETQSHHVERLDVAPQ
jgi:hypothetical protein